MKRTEKTRITKLIQTTFDQLKIEDVKLRERASRIAAKFSPTSAERFRDTAEFVWWLISLEHDADALQILNVLCEVDDEYYWMFDSMCSVFATRGWLHMQDGQTSGSDAQIALEWLERDPNNNRPTMGEIRRNLKRFDDWLSRADNENGDMTAAHVLSHALRVLVIYQQLAFAGVDAAKSVTSQEYLHRIGTALSKLRDRIRHWLSN